MRLTDPSGASKAFGVSKSLIYRLMKTGKIPYYEISSAKRLDLDELKKFFRRSSKRDEPMERRKHDGSSS